MTQPNLLDGDQYGVATQTGSTSTLIDSKKNWAKNQWFGCTLKIEIGSQIFTRTISGNNANIITFTPALNVQTMQGSNYRIINNVTRVSSGQNRPGISLDVNQQLLTFAVLSTGAVAHPYPIPWNIAPVAIGGSTPLYNVNTGIVTPYTVPQGYTLSVIERTYSANQDMTAYLYYDGLLVMTPILIASGNVAHDTNVVYFSTATFDPTGATSHVINVLVANQGLAVMECAVTFACILEAVSTPPFPTEKDTECPNCHAINHVDVHVTRIKCSNCGFDYIVWDTTNIRRL